MSEKSRALRFAPVSLTLVSAFAAMCVALGTLDAGHPLLKATIVIAFLATVGGSAWQLHDSRVGDAKRAEDTARTQGLIDGGDAYARIVFAHGMHGRGHFLLKHEGKYPLRDLTIIWSDRTRFERILADRRKQGLPEPELWDAMHAAQNETTAMVKVTSYAGHQGYDIARGYEFAKPLNVFDARFTAMNGHWIQQTLVYQDGTGGWAYAERMTRSNGTTGEHVELYAKVGDGFPKEHVPRHWGEEQTTAKAAA
jgi:hypothetical protein